MNQILFLDNCELEIVESFDEACGEMTYGENAVISPGRKFEAEIGVSDKDKNRSDLQFVNGDLAYFVPNKLFTIIKNKVDNVELYEDHNIDGLVVRGASNAAIVLSMGLISNFELHYQITIGKPDQNAFVNCYQWRKNYLEHLEKRAKEFNFK